MTPVADAMAAIVALRAQPNPPFDPVRLHFLEALARRTQAHQGAVRDLLEGKLAVALQDYQDRAAHAQSLPPPAKVSPSPSALAALTRQLVQQQPSGAPPDTNPLMASAASQPELKAVQYFRDTWSQLSLDRQMAQALAQAPENAGPLNSQQLVLRALSVMQTLSPAYFQHFMTYANALLWLEHADSKPTPKAATEGNGGKRPKTTRARAR